MALLPRPVTMMIWSQPEASASSTPYWMMGLSTRGSISLGCALVAGRNRVPSPAAGKTALRTRCFMLALDSRSAAPSLRHYRQDYTGSSRLAAKDPLPRRHVILILGLEDIVHELLRIAVDQREPRALHLHHDLVSLQEGMVVGVQAEPVLQRLVRRDGLRLLKAVAEASAEDLVGDDELVPAAERGVGIAGAAAFLFRLVIFWVDIDQLHDPVAVRARGGGEQVGHDFPRHHHVLRQRLRLPAQHVGAMVHEALVLLQPYPPLRPGIGGRHRPRAIGHGIRRIGDV